MNLTARTKPANAHVLGAAVLLLSGCTAISAQSVSAISDPGMALMPVPAHVSAGTGRLVFTGGLSVRMPRFHDARLDAAVGRTVLQLRQRTGLPLVAGTAGESASLLTIDVAGAGETVQSPDEDESYTLEVRPDGIALTAPTVVGALRGLSTLVQLVQTADGRFTMPAVRIEDSPRFRWRGLMVDCGRHFEPVDVLKRTLDGMAAVKLNVFHWHLTEDQGFRMESKQFPKLTGLGSDGLFYTQAEAMEVVRYARERGIRVVPEFEMPGHSTAWLVAYPELASGPAPTGIRREFGISDVALDPTREETYVFLQRFLAEMAAIFPDAYMHIGGDETVSPDWKSNPRIQAFRHAHGLKDSDALQAYFNGRVLKILTGLHKHMVGWDEILDPALPRDVVIQSWRGEQSLVSAARQGYQGILSAGYYLDAMKSAGEHYRVDPLPASAPLSAPQRALVLGGEICMFAEHVDARTIDSRIWPRSAAIAERFWSPEAVDDVRDMYRRLDAVSVQLESLGLHHLTQEDAGLRELAGTEQIADLRMFASAFEPVSFHERYEQQKTSQTTVLDRFVDAVRPDPTSRFRVQQLTRAFVANSHANAIDGAALAKFFEEIEGSVSGVRAQMATSPLLREDLAVHVAQMPGLARIGLEAVHFLSAGTPAPAGWRERSLARTEAAREPAGIVRFIFLDELVLLIRAVRS